MTTIPSAQKMKMKRNLMKKPIFERWEDINVARSREKKPGTQNFTATLLTRDTFSANICGGSNQ